MVRILSAFLYVVIYLESAMVNNIIGGSSLSAAIAVEKSIEPKKIAPQSADVTQGGTDISASVAAYLSLPGFNPAPAEVQATQNDNVQPLDKASAVVQAVAASDDDGLKLALKQFDEGLKKLAQRHETQIYQSKFSSDAASNDNDIVQPEPLPGVDENGFLDGSKTDMAADTNKDGKVSPDEMRRYQMPITYRSSQHASDAQASGPSAFSLAEAHRAYGVVATEAAVA